MVHLFASWVGGSGRQGQSVLGVRSAGRGVDLLLPALRGKLTSGLSAAPSKPLSLGDDAMNASQVHVTLVHYCTFSHHLPQLAMSW